MSKVFHFLRYLLFITLLALIVLTKGADSVSACQTINDFDVCNNPELIDTDTQQVTFIITPKRDNVFFDVKTVEYRAIAWKGDSADPTSDNTCLTLGSSYNTPDPTSTAKQLVFSWGLGDACRKQLGKWHFRIWGGTTGIQNTPRARIIIPDYPFEIEQVGGGTLSIEASYKRSGLPYLGVTEPAQVDLYNARKGSWYQFWWQGSAFDLAAPQIQASSDNNILNINLVKPDDWRNNPTGDKTLCMNVTDRAFNEPSQCKFSAIFHFELSPPPPVQPPPPPGTPGSCAIKIYAAHQPMLKKDDSVSAVITNLPPNQEFRTELINEGGTQVIKPIKQNSDQSGSITLPLKDHIEIGKYTVNNYDTTDTNNKPLCTQTFEVTTDGSPTQSKNCGDQGTTCTKVGEDSSCGNDKNPGIKTAIGCIHTNPAEFVKDVMTFVIGISGGLAFLLMILGAFQMLTSAGNPETLHAGRERLTSAVIGLLIVIFATLLLQIIGFDILKIPGFGR